ncbi:low-density lipoprotein receptor [Plakobranchus ocellatus]|uniref:Low-density lipoprotein receptor n=1 Tax=Plakobranchus ocellatus TaxID=259542 RepID=A0AAV4DZ20_9GAST|nr:low-density lipoprotein receptor [Plakobranchus ocellatus]
MLNDSVLNCQGPEGPLDETLGALESINCSQTGEMTFINYWAPKCVLVRDNFGELIGCRDFQHLAGCSDFSCPMNFVKCPESFCIPLSYVGDGKQDCDYGEDEGEHVIMNINNFFICDFRSKQRVSLSAICDGKKDCALGQDELECGIHCSPGFICLPGAIMVYNIREILTPQLLSFTDTQTRYLDLSTVRVPEFFHIYPRGRLHYLFYLKLSRCDINTVSINFRKYASLSKNYNSKTDQRSRYLNFEGTKISDISQDVFSNVKALRELLSPTYKLCCPVVLDTHIQSLYTCHFSDDSIHSCDDLIEEAGLRALLWIVCSATLMEAQPRMFDSCENDGGRSGDNMGMWSCGRVTAFDAVRPGLGHLFQ